jgi:hypothetical protein
MAFLSMQFGRRDKRAVDQDGGHLARRGRAAKASRETALPVMCGGAS